MDKNIPWNLLVEKLSGTISAERLALLNKWLAEPGNKDIYTEVEEIWWSARNKVALYEPDKDRAWEKLSARMDAPREKSGKLRISKIARRIAASSIAACLLLGAAWFGVMFSDGGGKASVASVYRNESSDSRAYVSLPDGSSVWLRPQSSLIYSESLKTGQREVELEGEAFFDVVSDERRMFVVNSNGVAVKVHGTRFNVGADLEKHDVSVVLVEGAVSLVADRKELMLSPGESAQYNKLTGGWRLEKTESELAAVWTMDRLQFEDKPLGHICKYLAVWYGIHIDIDPGLAEGQAYNFTVTDQSKEEIMAMLAKVTGFSYFFDSSGLHIR